MGDRGWKTTDGVRGDKGTRQETRDKRQETRDGGQETRLKRHETRDKRRVKGATRGSSILLQHSIYLEFPAFASPDTK